MASLTTAAITSRKAIRYGIYFVILVIVSRWTIFSATKIYRRYFPEEPKPTVEFGKLPDLPFPSTGREQAKNLTYTLEILDDSPPKFPKQARIYSMPKIQPDIGSLDRAKKKAGQMGFDPEGQELVETVYHFTSKTDRSSLDMNIINNIFSITSDLRFNSSIYNSLPPSSEDAISFALSFLKKGELLTNDIAKGRKETVFLRKEGNQFVPAISLSEANLTKVNLFRSDYGRSIKYQSVTPNFKNANVWFLLASGTKRSKASIAAAEYHYFPVADNPSSTYPIKTFDQAWEDLKKGMGYVAQRGNIRGGEVTIRSAYLGYYDPGQYVPYYQPVFVFLGDDDFIAYVPAVTGEYYGAEAGLN